MTLPHPIDPDSRYPPFDQFKSIRPLATSRSGREAGGPARHQLYAARDRRTSAQVLIKVTSRPGRVYEQNLANEIASLTTINQALPTTRYFPEVREHGRLKDGRIFLITSLFDEFPLATSIGPERVPSRLVGHLRTAIEVTRALCELHALPIYHVDLNPMNVLYRAEKGAPVIRIVDFESSYEPARHGSGIFYDPPTTPGYSAPEVSSRPPDARADVFSLGAVLYTMVAGFAWTWKGDAQACVAGDDELEPELRDILARAVAANPDARYPTAAALQATLAGYLERIWPGRAL